MHLTFLTLQAPTRQERARHTHTQSPTVIVTVSNYLLSLPSPPKKQNKKKTTKKKPHYSEIVSKLLYSHIAFMKTFSKIWFR